MLLLKTDKKNNALLQEATVTLVCHEQNNRILPCFYTYKRILQTCAEKVKIYRWQYITAMKNMARIICNTFTGSQHYEPRCYSISNAYEQYIQSQQEQGLFFKQDYH